MKLSDKTRDVLRLLMRSPDHGDGWRKVSGVLWLVVTPSMPDDLVEKQPSSDGGRVRLTERGKAVCDYLI